MRRAARDLALDLNIRDAAEPREHFKFQELSIVKPQRLRRLSQGRRLGLAADTADACPDIDRRLVALVEQPRIKNDLAVGDRDQVGWNVGAQIAGIQFGDRQGGQRPAAGGLRKFRSAFEQPCMDIEHVAGVSLAPRRLLA